MSDFPGALDIRTTHYGGWSVPFQPRFVIVHGTAGFQTAQEVAQFFQTNNPPTSVHYVVGRDGVIVQCVAESDAAWGNGGVTGPPGVGGDGVHHDAWWDHSPDGNPNTWTFSIEHVKPSADNSDILTAAQQDASFRLIAHLCSAHGIPARAADAQGGVTGHYSMDPVNRARCPGPYPWQALWAYLANGGGGTSMTWQNHGAGAMDAHGHTVGAGLADLLISAHAADGNRSETPFDAAGDVYVDLSDGNVATWTHAEGSRFDRGGLVIAALNGQVSALHAQFTNEQGVAKALSQEAASLQSQLSNANATIASLQAQLATAGKLPAKAQAAISCMDAIAAYTKLP